MALTSFDQIIDQFIACNITKKLDLEEFILLLLRRALIVIPHQTIKIFVALSQKNRYDFVLTPKAMKDFGITSEKSPSKLYRFAKGKNLIPNVHYKHQRYPVSTKHTAPRFLHNIRFSICGLEKLLLSDNSKAARANPKRKIYMMLLKAREHYEEYKKSRADYLFSDPLFM